MLSTVLLAGVSGSELPFAGGDAPRLDVGPLDSVSAAAASVWRWLAHEPVVLAAAIVVGAAAALVPWARRHPPLGIATLGFAVTATSVLAGAGIASTFVVMLVWAGFGLATAVPRRA